MLGQTEFINIIYFFVIDTDLKMQEQVTGSLLSDLYFSGSNIIRGISEE